MTTTEQAFYWVGVGSTVLFGILGAALVALGIMAVVWKVWLRGKLQGQVMTAWAKVYGKKEDRNPA